MAKEKTMLMQLLGTTTKVRILEHLIIEGGGISRYTLSRRVGTGIGPTYEQVDQLIALGVLMEVGNKLEMDPSFPFYESLVELVVTMNGYMDELRVLLERVDRLFQNDYYITGYLAACQNGPPIDHLQDTALVAILRPDSRAERYIGALSECTTTEIQWFTVKKIESDIKRFEIFGLEIWIASIERAMVDCIKYKECDIYPVALLLLQNGSQGNIDWGWLLEIAGEEGVSHIFNSLVYEISLIPIEISGDILKIIKVSKKTREIQRAVKMARNTVMG